HGNLRCFARALGLGGREAARSAAAALDLVGLAARADEPVARLSGGMRRRLNLACGILHRPAVLLLDEPVVGVDPQSRERIFEAIETLARAGAAVPQMALARPSRADASFAHTGRALRDEDTPAA